ncbi:MAG: GHKL domain-containing protein [Oscillospiraceae bacterium]
MEYIISAMMLSVETFSFWLMAEALLTKKNQRLQNAIAFMVSLIFGFSIVNFITHVNVSIVKTMVTIFTWYMVVLFAFTDSWIKKLFVVLSSIVMIYCIDYISACIVMAVFSITSVEIYASVPYFILGAFISKTALFTLSALLFAMKNEKYKMNKVSNAECFRLILIPVFTVLNLVIVVDCAIRYSVSPVLVMVDACGLLLCNIFLVYISNRLEQERFIKKDNEMLLQQARENEEKATAMLDIYTGQRKLVHDFKNHILSMQMLIKMGEYEKAEAYMTGLCEEIQIAGMAISTDNPIADVLLNQKFAAAKAKKVTMHISSGKLDSFPLENGELVTVLGNLLDNALEAAEKLAGKGQIYVNIHTQESETMLSVKNSVKYDVHIINNQIFSTKANPLLHGYGLQNVIGVLQKHGWTYVMQCENGWFQFTAMAPQ